MFDHGPASERGHRRFLIFLDVDGPLIPFRARSRSRPSAEHPLLDRLDPADGRRLVALGGRLVWATTWGPDANEVVAPRLGLPRLPVVDWPDDDEEPAGGRHWKTAGLVAWAAGRPFVWLDDEITDADRWWVEACHPGAALLRRVDPYAGLAEPDYAAVAAWIRRLR